MSGNNGCPNDENDYEVGMREEREDVVAFLRSLADLDGLHSGYLRTLATRIGEEREHVGALKRRRERQGW